MDKIYIDKLSDYIKFIEDLDFNFKISRGQSKNYLLLPGAFRRDGDGNTIYSSRKINSLLEEFKVNSYQYMENPSDIKCLLEWEVYAQHYGLPTKLLDFSTSHLASLLFAVEKAFESLESQEESVVYFLNPYELNNKNIGKREILNSFDDSPIVADGPIVIQSRKLNVRINAQDGLFVYYKEKSSELDLLEEEILKKVYIKPEFKKKILSSLFSMGVTFSSIYPELNYVVKDIMMKENLEAFAEEGE